MASDGSIIIDLGLNDQNFKNALSSIGNTAKSGLKSVATSIGVASTALAGFGVAGIKVGMEFEAAMSQVGSTMGMTAEEIRNGNEAFAMLEKAAKDAGKSTKFSAKESADALNYLALAGYDAEKSVEALPVVLDLAAAGGMDLAYASDLVTDSMSALGLTTSELTGFTDQLTKTSQKSNTNIAQLGEAILTVGGTAKNLAGGTVELNAALGILADNGIKGSEGGTALRNVILSLTAPMDKAAVKMKELGLEVFDADGNMRPLNETFKDLDRALSELSQEEKIQALDGIFNKVDLKSVNALLANCGQRFDELSGYIENSNGATAEASKTMNDNLAGALTTLKSALEGLGIEFYQNIDEPAKNAVKSITDMIGEMTNAVEAGGLEGLTDNIGSVLSEITTSVAKYTPKMINMGVDLIQSFLRGISTNSEEIAKSGVKIGESLIKGIAKILPEVVNTVKKVVVDMAKEIANINPIFKPLAETVKLLVNNLEYLAIAIGTTVVAFKAFTIITAVSKAIHALSAAYRVANVQLQVHVAMLGVARVANAADLATLSAKSIVVGALTGRVQLAAAAQALWNIALNANPIGLVVTAVGLLVAGLGILAIATNEVSEEEAARIQRLEELKESTEELTQNVNDNIAAYENSVDSIKKSADASMAELGYVEDLANELSTLADENGNVEEANRGRVSFILNELNEALGKEYSMTGNQIDNYKDMSASIYDLIEAEKARIILSAYEDELTEAIKRQTAAKKEAQNAVDNLKIAQEETNKIVSDYINYVRDASGVTITQEQAIKDLENSFRGLSQPINEFKDEFSEQKEIIKGNEDAIKELGNAQQAFTETQKQYSDAYAAYAIGNVTEVTNSFGINEKLKQEIVNKSNDDILDMILANNAEVERLEQEKSKAVDQALINGYQVQIETTREQGKLLVNEFEKTGQNCVNALAQKLLEKAAVDNAAAALALSVTRIVNSKFEIKSPSRVFMRIGSYLSQGLAIGITAAAPLALNSIDRLNNGILNSTTDAGKRLNEAYKQRNTDFGNQLNEAYKLNQAYVQNSANFGKRLNEAYGLNTSNFGQRLNDAYKQRNVDFGKQLNEAYKLTEAYAQNTKALEEKASEDRKKNNKELLLFQKESDKLELKDAQALLKAKIDAEKLSSEEQVYILDYITEKYKLTATERLKIEKQKSDTLKKMQKEEFEYSKKWIKDKKDLNQLSLNEELLAYERMMKRYAEGTDERIEAEKNFLRVQEEIRKEDFNNSKKWIKNKKDLNQLSLAEELLAYERVMDRYEEGSEERIEAEKEYFRVKSEMSKKIEELEKSYYDAVEKRRNELMNFSGVFETITIEMSDTNFIESLESQIAALELYNDSLQELMERGLNEGIIDELKKLGPKSAGLLQELADSSDADLQKISDLYAEKFKLANEQATTESVEIKENVDKSIADMLAGVEDKFEASIAKAPQYGSGFVNNFNSGAKAKKPELINTATDLGQSASSGLAQGILNGENEVADALIRVVRNMIRAAMEELDSHSPSKKFIKIGMDVDNGLAIGIKDNMDVVEKASKDMANAVNPEFTFKSHVIPPKMFPDGTKFTPDIMAGFTNVLKDIKIVVENTVQNIYPTPLLNGNQSNVVYNNTQKETVQNFYVPVDTPLQSYLKRRVGTA